ncbi:MULTISPECIES: FmdB family zinc ribbon protein [Cryobacterium]|uniref:FmdB family transcriptional regulator n=1 Tax=Cryobacterium levicorallinum TaxID=995038 RepID=A0A1I3C6F2_9MICO|nr:MULTISPECIES: FmdB family zinc ribbon protein [Cryobacterium]TFB83278.1 FmdB family transcriptional regulator [Cryobacterium levicorallinum]TFD58296.1 FmdB family transcriptional regulator [Cryobacterium sp. Hh38]GEP27550.1 FmdB family transcriptional regulator [Cryobacterium levicorallinum]SFH70124.1 putative regulatory protein, FmdB family [Cryobacterium levicorallinum]
MPTYSYRCTECDTAFDIQQAFTDHSLTVCPTCQGKLRKVFSSIGVTFSGSGFYSNDSKSDAKRSNPNLDRKPSESSSDKSDSSASKPAETKTEKKADSTPAKSAAPSVPTAKAS